jgi:uncharacterized protein (TIGR01777 family)
VQPKTFSKRSDVPAPKAQLAAWHMRPGAFQRLSPPWVSATLDERAEPLEDGARAVIKMKAGPLSRRWVAVHSNVDRQAGFTDEQVSGPFAQWRHDHLFDSAGADASVLTDNISYRVPLGALGQLVAGRTVAGEVRRMFTYRHAITLGDLRTHKRYGGKPMRIAITGSTGLVGKALTSFLTTGGHEVIEISRRDPGTGNTWVKWDADKGISQVAELEGLDAVVHLAGENIAGGRWTKARKAAILNSRVDGTTKIVEALSKLLSPPRTLVCASAIGFYGECGDDIVDEDADPGEGYLSEVCKQWEAASEGAKELGIRVVNLRIGVVISAAGGALAQSLPVFRLGLGGKISDGSQWMSWIALDDLLDIVLHCLRTPSLAGPVNAVAPYPCTNAEYTRALGSTLNRPVFAPLPAFAARLALGELADALLLTSTRVEPSRLEGSGYEFRLPRIAGALAHTLGRTEEAEERAAA